VGIPFFRNCCSISWNDRGFRTLLKCTYVLQNNTSVENPDSWDISWAIPQFFFSFQDETAKRHVIESDWNKVRRLGYDPTESDGL
jgi:hypothetical protein